MDAVLKTKADAEALAAFAASPTIEGQVHAVTQLIKSKAIHRAVSDDAFTDGLKRLLHSVKSGERPESRLLALAAMLRIAAVSKAIRERVQSTLEALPAEGLPPGDLLDDADDRYYVACVWRYTQAPWMGKFLAQLAVREESGENARIEALTGLLASTGSIASSIECLRVELRQVTFTTQKRGDSLGRRVRKVSEQLCKAMNAVDVVPGVRPGNELAALVDEAFRTTRGPDSIEVSEGVADAVATLVDGIVRGNFSLATESETYAPLEAVKRWFSNDEWQRHAGKSKPFAAVARDVEQGIRILVRAGRTDDRLFQSLAIAAGSQDAARSIAVGMASDTAGLAEDVRRWLVGSPAKRQSEFAAENLRRDEDELLAALMLDVKTVSGHLGPIGDDVLPELMILAPRLAPTLARLLALLSSVVSTMDLLASRRNLIARGGVGEVVEFAPLEHQMVGGDRPGVRLVRLLSPVVESGGAEGRARIVRKALVEPAE
jgi:hypothetical protein